MVPLLHGMRGLSICVRQRESVFPSKSSLSFPVQLFAWQITTRLSQNAPLIKIIPAAQVHVFFLFAEDNYSSSKRRKPSAHPLYLTRTAVLRYTRRWSLPD